MNAGAALRLVPDDVGADGALARENFVPRLRLRIQSAGCVPSRCPRKLLQSGPAGDGNLQRLHTAGLRFASELHAVGTNGEQGHAPLPWHMSRLNRLNVATSKGQHESNGHTG